MPTAYEVICNCQKFERFWYRGTVELMLTSPLDGSEWSVSFSNNFTPEKETLVPMEQEAVWTQSIHEMAKRTIHHRIENQTPAGPACIQVTLLIVTS